VTDIETIPDLRARHRHEEARVLRAALVAEGWIQARAARRLSVGQSSLRAIVARYPELQAEMLAQARPRGRPSGGPKVKWLIPKPQTGRHESVVYAIAADDAAKIGLSCNLRSRVSTLATDTPLPLTVLWWTWGGADLENAIHSALAKDRIRGEWFSKSAVLDHLETNF
jgi:hypothetical protein